MARAAKKTTTPGKATPRARKPKAPAASVEPAFTGVTHLSLIVDRSGSMNSCWSEAVNGLEEFRKTQAALPGKATMTLVVFDTEVDVILNKEPLEKVEPMNRVLAQHGPRGCTALYDAISRGAQAFGTIGKNDRALLLILTDGHENASTETTKEAATAIIKGLEATGRWTTTYLSSSPTAWADAAVFGVNVGNVGTFAVGARGMTTGGQRLNAATTSYRGGGQSMTSSFYSTTPPVPEASIPDPKQPAAKGKKA